MPSKAKTASKTRTLAKWDDEVSQSRDTQSKRKRDAVVRMAAREFSARGYHGTSLDDIAAALNVTKAALYYYVSGKQEILFEIHTQALDFGYEALDLACQEGRNGLERLALFLKTYIKWLTSEFGACAVLTEVSSLEKEHRLIVQSRRDTFDAALRQVMHDGVADGSIVPCRVQLVEMMIMGAVNWIPRWYRPDGANTSEEIGDAFVAALLQGLAPRPAAARAKKAAAR